MRIAKLQDSRLRAADKAVLCAISAYHNETSGYSYPSLSQIGAAACVRDRHSLIGVIKRLEAYGFLTVKRVPGRGSTYVVSPTIGEGNPASVENNTSAENHTSAEIHTTPVRKFIPHQCGNSHHTSVENHTQNTKEIQIKQKEKPLVPAPAPARETAIPAHPIAPKFKAWGVAHRLIDTGDPEVFALTGGRKESSAGQLVSLLTGSDAGFQKVHPLLVKHQISV